MRYIGPGKLWDSSRNASWIISSLCLQMRMLWRLDLGKIEGERRFDPSECAPRLRWDCDLLEVIEFSPCVNECQSRAVSGAVGYETPSRGRRTLAIARVAWSILSSGTNRDRLQHTHRGLPHREHLSRKRSAASIQRDLAITVALSVFLAYCCRGEITLQVQQIRHLRQSTGPQSVRS